MSSTYATGANSLPPDISFIRQRLDELNARLMTGSSADDYDDSLRLIDDIKRVRTPPPQIDIGTAQSAPARIAYAIDRGAHGPEFSQLVLRYESDLSWWLKRYADDPNRPEPSRSFVKVCLSPGTEDKLGSNKAALGGKKQARSEISRPAEKIALTTADANKALSDYVIHYPRSSEKPPFDLYERSRIGFVVFLFFAILAAQYFTGFLMSLSTGNMLLLFGVVAAVLLALYFFALGYDRRSVAAENKRALDWFSSPEGILLRSAKSGDIQALQAALGDGAPPDASGATGITALMLASAGGHARMVHLLLRAGADPNRFDAAGNNALVHAAVNGQAGVVQQLIKHGANHTARNSEGKTALVAMIDHPGFARQPAHPEIVRLMIAEGHDIEVADNKGRLPLIAAVESGSAELVRAFLEAGSDPNCLYTAPNDYQADVTPLLVASYLGDGACVEVLLRGGADHRVRSLAEITPLMLAAGASKDDKAAEDELAGRSGHAVKARVRAVQALISAGADVSARDGSGGTAIMYATHMDRDTIIRRLAKAGADLDATEDIQMDHVQRGPILETRIPMDQSGVTALMFAAGQGRTMAAIALVELGANIEIRNSDGFTALEIAKRTHPDTAAAMSKAVQRRAPRIETVTT